MTIVNTVPPVGSYVPPFLPLDSVSPFTYRDGTTYLQILHDLRRYVNETLVTFINTNFDQLGDAFATETNLLITSINTHIDTVESNLQTALTAQTTDNDTKIADLTEYVDTEIQAIVNNSLSANDGIVKGLVNQVDSLTRIALDAVYQGKGTVADAAVKALLDTATSTRNALDGRYFQSSGSTLDVPHGGTGRTAQTPNALVAGGADADDPQVSVAVGTAGQYLKSNGPDSAPGFVTLIDDAAAGATKTYSSTKVEALVASKSIYDLFANRPAIGTVKDGTIFACSDLPEQYIAQGGVWRVIGSGGNELGYAEITAQSVTAAGTGTTPVVVTGLATTFKVGVRPIRIILCADVANELVNTKSFADILLDGVKVYTLMVPSGPNSADWVTGTASVRVPSVGGAALVPGSTHTVSVQIYSATNGGRVHMTGNAGSPGNLQVVTV